MPALLLQNAQIYQNKSFFNGDVLVEDGVITAIGENLTCPPQTVVHSLGGALLAPGLIDIHTHGGDGVDVNDATPAQLDQIGAFFARHGTTGWLCSILTDTKEKTLECIENAVLTMQSEATGAKLLGIHLEGPYLAAEYKGAMPEYLLRTGDSGLFHVYQKAAQGNVRYMTVAPEVENVNEMIAELADEVTIAIGHSGAAYEVAKQAIDNGVKACTHTFNAMGLFHQHRPSVMGAVLESDIYCEAICDGLHLHPASVRMLLKCKGWDKVVCITDSIQAAGLPDGNYKLGVNDVVVKNGDACLASNGVRAGSTLSQDRALRNLMAFTGCSIEMALPLFTENPARLVGLLDRKGTIEVGKDADFTVLTPEGNVLQTIVGGKTVYTA